MYSDKTFRCPACQRSFIPKLSFVKEIVLSKDNQEILPDLADFVLQEQLQHHLMVAISPAWYTGSCTMATKLIKPLDLHYTMIQFLMKEYRQ